MKVIKQYRIKPGLRFHSDDVDPNDKGQFDSPEDVFEETEKFIGELDSLQERLFSESKQSLLIILQALDTGGKDGTIRHVMRGINPQGCHVASFKVPTPEEASHDFLWRIHRHAPAKGTITIFNRSHYEDVLVTRVHGVISAGEAKRRFREINEFESALAANSTTIVKFYLAISRDEQKRRLQARVDDPHKRWKFSPNDLKERRYWDRYAKTYEEVVSATSTIDAPWYVIPGNHKWYRNYLVAKTLVATLQEMDPQYPAAIEGVDFSKIRIPS